MVKQTTDDGIEVAKRTAKLSRVDDLHAPGDSEAYEVVVSLYEYVDHPNGKRVIGDFPAETQTFAFVTVTDDLADVIRGDMPATDGTPVIEIGSNFGKNYYQSQDRTIPVDVLESLHKHGLQVVTGVNGGWSSWDGRPEFSDTFADFSEAVAVDMENVIAERRERDQ